MQGSMEAMDVDPIFGDSDKEQLVIEQASVFIEDAVKYRSIHHKTDQRSLQIYCIYYSNIVRWGLTAVIILDLGLAFFEYPSSLTMSSDPRFRGPRPEVPCGILEVVEILCLLCFVCDVIVKSHLLGGRQLIKNRWLLAYMSILVISFVDLFVSLSTGCKEVVRVRRLLRPFFLVQNSSLTKKLLRAIKRTLPEIMSVLFLLFLHLFFFTMFGMLLFPRESWADVSHNKTSGSVMSKYCAENTSDSGAICEGSTFFSNLPDSMRSLFVLLTTANNPDVMMPAYMKNRFYAIYFILFTLIGLYCFLNLLTAVIYNQFRGYLLKSLQSSLFRRRLGVRAAFEVLCTLNPTDDGAYNDFVAKEKVRLVIEKAKLDKRRTQLLKDALTQNNTGIYRAREFQDLFDVLESHARQRQRPPMSFVSNVILRRIQMVVSSHLFDYFGDFIAGVNVIFVSVMLDVQYDTSVKSSHSALAAANLFFVLYYLFEQSVKLWSLGMQRYVSFKGNVYCGAVTLLLVFLEIIFLILHGSPFSSDTAEKPDDSLDYLLSAANLIRIINMLIIFRLLRIVPNIKALSLVAETLMNLLRNLSPFAGLIVAIYYVFAIFGMMLFPNVTDPTERCAIKTNSTTKPCTTLGFDNLQYYANNFDDFAASLVLLWDIMIVNNWHIFLKAYAQLVNSWSQLYFLAWYLVSVIISINLFVALILEAFVDQWEMRQQRKRTASTSATLQSQQGTSRFHQMFRSALVEPQEVEILSELRNHEYLKFNVCEVIID